MATKQHLILIVDDRPDNREAISDALTIRMELTVDTAADAEETWSKLSRDPRPSLVVLDLGLLNDAGQTDKQVGLALCKAIRQRYRALPIIMVTAQFERDDVVEECLTAGATDFVDRLSAETELLLRIRNALDFVEVLEELTASRDTVALHRELLALFAGAVGHDGRNALVAITALLSNRELCDVDEIWESAVVQTGVLPKLFNFLEDVGKTGGELRCDGFEITEATREIVHLSAALRKSYTISLAGAPEEPIDVWGHRTLYMLVLAELVRNAINTMQQRGQGDRVSIAVSRQPDTVCIDIFDNGPGVPDDDREAIFKKGMTTRDDGTGRGLYHARASLALMEATITCEQRTGGAHFRIQLRRTASVKA